MTRTTRKTVCAITLLCVLLAVFVFIAWGTSGFRNWNASTWFNSWGKGAPKTEKVIETPDDPKEPEDPDKPLLPSMPEDSSASASAVAANAGLVYDSDDATATIDVAKMPMINAYLVTSTGLCIYTYSNNVKTLSVTYGNLHTGNFLTKEYTYIYPSVIIPFDEIADCVGGYGTPFSASFVNIGNDSLLDSDPTNVHLYLPREDLIFIEPVFTGSKIRINLPFPYSYLPANPGSFDTHNTLRITIYAPLDDETEFTVLNGSIPDGGTSSSVTYSDIEDLSESPFTLCDTDDVDYFEIDILKAKFANRMIDCRVEVSYKSNYTYYDLETLCTLRSFYFSISKLASPQNIAYAEGVLSWDAVTNAQGYALFDGDTVVESNITTTSYDLKTSEYDWSSGEHTIRLRALGNVGKQAAASEAALASLTPYNAPMNITQLAVINYSVDGDVVTKFVPVDGKLGDYLYDVEIPKKEFGGWYYDSGFSREVGKDDKITGDVTVYARLMDKKVAQPKQSWWDKYKWFVLIPCFVLVAAGVAVVGVIATKKKKSA